MAERRAREFLRRLTGTALNPPIGAGGCTDGINHGTREQLPPQRRISPTEDMRVVLLTQCAIPSGDAGSGLCLESFSLKCSARTRTSPVLQTRGVISYRRRHASAATNAALTGLQTVTPFSGGGTQHMLCVEHTHRPGRDVATSPARPTTRRRTRMHRTDTHLDVFE